MSSIVWIFICILACMLFRMQFALLLLPALAAFLMSVRNPARSWRNFMTVYGILSVLFLISLWLPANRQGSLPVRQVQSAFFALHGNTRFALDTLKPGMVSFLRILPQAAVNGTLRPFLWEAKGWLQYAISLERTFIILCLGIGLIRKRGRWSIDNHPLLLFFLFFSISLLLLEAMVVPFPGALVRYAAIPELLLLITGLVGLNADKTNILNK